MGTTAEAQALERERERGRALAFAFLRFLGLTWDRRTSEKGLRDAVEDLTQSLSDVLHLDELGRDEAERAADEAAEAALFGLKDADEEDGALDEPADSQSDTLKV